MMEMTTQTQSAIWAVLNRYGYGFDDYQNDLDGVLLFVDHSYWPTLRADELRELVGLMDELTPLGVTFRLGHTQVGGDSDNKFVIIAQNIPDPKGDDEVEEDEEDDGTLLRDLRPT